MTTHPTHRSRPWPPRRAEIEAFGADGLSPTRLEITAIPGQPDDHRWLAEFRRPTPQASPSPKRGSRRGSLRQSNPQSPKVLLVADDFPPPGASRAAANQTSIDWPSVVPASSSRFVNSLRRVTVARLAATGSR
jgi:hypothetical protein